MNKFFTVIFLFLSVTVAVLAQNPRDARTRDHAVLLSAEVRTSPPSIKLKWVKNDLAVRYEIYRKKVNDAAWSSAIAVLDSNAKEYIDNNVVSGIAYEYQVAVYSYGVLNSINFYFYGFGYILTGIDVKEYDQQGMVLLLIDSTLKDNLSSEILRLKKDLRAEGWGVIERYASRTEAFDGNKVKETKKIVTAEYEKYGDNLKSIFILGRVAVPYSGNLNPDAHPDHKGAWPADIYYGYMIPDTFWGDDIINNSTAGRQENKNIPGDGKFDATVLSPQTAEIAVGRVDMYGMNLFLKDGAFTETDLIRKYLEKDHKYRTGGMTFTNSGIIDDNFGISIDSQEGFASSGWRNFGVLAGPENVKESDWFTELGTESHLFAYGCGGGSYNSAGGIGVTQDFVDKPVHAVFTMLFGSYFGDWDSENNFLRAPLASGDMALTCVWAGRPHWYFHHLAYGYPIGYSALITHNNYSLYKPNIVYDTVKYPNGVIFSVGMQLIHTALMGDPTLKLNSNTILPVTNVIANQNAGEGKQPVKITWTGPAIGQPLHFNVYRATSEFGLYKKINTSPVTDEQFTDIIEGQQLDDFTGKLYYMVRTVMLETNNSGRYYNLSLGETASTVVTDVRDNNALTASVSVSPNPAFEKVSINYTTTGYALTNIEITDMNGNHIITLFNDYLPAGNHSANWNLNSESKLPVNSGIYFIKIVSGKETLTQKLSIIK